MFFTDKANIHGKHFKIACSNNLCRFSKFWFFYNRYRKSPGRSTWKGKLVKRRAQMEFFLFKNFGEERILKNEFLWCFTNLFFFLCFIYFFIVPVTKIFFTIFLQALLKKNNNLNIGNALFNYLLEKNCKQEDAFRIL